MPWWHENLYYNMHSKYNYYIDIDDMTIVKQKCLRSLKNLSDISNDKIATNNIVDNNEKFIKLAKSIIESECNKKDIIQMNKKWSHDYKQQRYKFMSREQIFNNVSKILNNSL